jgi:isopentenyl-diphosphate delta-isomerase
VKIEETVILVDRDDQQTGTMEKMEAHLQGRLHRAFSVFIFNKKGELLLQRRADGKYHSGGKWTNTCCSHPRPGELTLEAAHRRLQEEMGIACELNFVFSFIYHAVIQDDLVENEYDHVFFGVTDALPIPDHDEVSSFKYITMARLATDLKENPGNYTRWIAICFDEVMAHYQQLQITNGQ